MELLLLKAQKVRNESCINSFMAQTGIFREMWNISIYGSFSRAVFFYCRRINELRETMQLHTSRNEKMQQDVQD